MTTIWKYEIPREHEFELLLPVGYEFLHVQCMPNGLAYVWARVSSDVERTPVAMALVGTGWEIPPEAVNYIGTFNQGMYVWHLFTK